MSFQKLPPELRDAWRGDAVTREAIALIRGLADSYSEKAFGYLSGGNFNEATLNAGAARALRALATDLETT